MWFICKYLVLSTSMYLYLATSGHVGLFLFTLAKEFSLTSSCGTCSTMQIAVNLRTVFFHLPWEYPAFSAASVMMPEIKLWTTPAPDTAFRRKKDTKAASVSLLVFLYMLQQVYLYSLGCGVALTVLGIDVALVCRERDACVPIEGMP